MVDSLKLYQILKAGHLPEEQARAMTVAIQAAETEVTSDMQTFFRREFEAMEQRLVQRWKLDLAETKADLMRWMFIFWVGQMAVTVGLVFAGIRLTR